jgi:hypothetical protein
VTSASSRNDLFDFFGPSPYGNGITPIRILLSTPHGYLAKQPRNRLADFPRLHPHAKPGVDGIESPDYGSDTSDVPRLPMLAPHMDRGISSHHKLNVSGGVKMYQNGRFENASQINNSKQSLWVILQDQRLL